MLVTCIARVAAPALAADTPVALEDQKGEIHVPESYEVTLDFKGQSESDMATWTSTKENNRLEISCGDKATPSQDPGQDPTTQDPTRQPGHEGYETAGKEDMHYDKAVLKVGDQKHELAADNTFSFTCPEGKYANVTDSQGNNIASLQAPLTMTVTRVHSQKDMIQGSL